VKWYSQWVDRLGLTNRPRLRKLLVAVIGSTVVLFGLALIVLSGPAVVVVPLGFAILATEFVWARRLVRRGEELWSKMRRRKRPGPANSLGNDAA
jgi:tellurite resistance protein TerC